MVNNIEDPYIDTDVFIRFFTSDDLKKQQKAAILFEKVTAGKILLKIPVTVIADCVYVLSSPRLYNLPRKQIRDLISTLVKPSNFRLDDKQAVLNALDLYASTNLDFSDAYLICLVKQSKDKVIYSYDHDFDKISGVTRKEP